MLISRRAFTAGALGIAVSTPWAPSFAQAPAPKAQRRDAALAAIRAHGEAHLSYFGIPGMTLGLTGPDGFAEIMNFGHANADARTPIAPDTLFQIGSISKVMVAALLHQLAATGRLRLEDQVTDLLPAAPLPQDKGVTVQQLLDHSAGLPNFAQTFPPGGLWLGYPPGRHYYYSNTGYNILGELAEHVGGAPLAQLLRRRLFEPLGMTSSRGAIIGADRLLFAQGYEAADQARPWVPRDALAPAPWVDVTFGAGSVASTASDMIRFMRSLSDAASGKGGLGLGPAQALALIQHRIPSDMPGRRYGNGLMHVIEGGRSYLHHTGGMLSFSSSFHFDPASGVGAFASSNLGSPDYRPRLLTRYAVDLLTNAMAGRPLPYAPALMPPPANRASYLGRYSGPAGEFEIVIGNPLSIIAGGTTGTLFPWGGEAFRTNHPRFREFGFLFEREGGAINGAAWGADTFIRHGSAATVPRSDPALARLAGRYISTNPWLGPFNIVERGGKLWVGTDSPLTRLGENSWRAGDKDYSPERLSFADFIDGTPQTMIFSAERFHRNDF